MLKWFNKKRKDNKGFTLVELVIVVAILAILVGILAPQYTKYVERSRRSADAANLENLVGAVKVAAADNSYNDLIPATGDENEFIIKINATETKIELQATSGNIDISGNSVTGAAKALQDALKEYAGDNWASTTLKSKAWAPTGLGQNEATYIQATCTIADSGSVTVVYNPVDVKNNVKED